MASVIQQGVQWLIDKVSALDAAAKKQEAIIRSNHARVATLRANAEKITDSVKRLAARKSAAGLAKHQADIEKLFAGFVTRYRSARSSAIAWMKAQGLLKGTSLGELGNPIILVPVAVAGVLLTVWGVIVAIEKMNTPQLKALALEESRQKALFAGQITTEQFTAAAAAQQKALEDTRPTGDPLGLSKLADSLVPIGLMVVAIMVLPSLLEAWRSSQPRRRKAVAA